jgi:hypothetical protein
MHALRAMCTSGSALFLQGYLDCVNEHFKDVLDRLITTDGAVDLEPMDADDEVFA